MISLWRFILTVWEVALTYDEGEWLICESCKWRAPWGIDSPHACPRCALELHVQVPRDVGFELALYDLRTAFFPQRSYLYGDGEKTTMYWTWRGRTLVERQVANPFLRDG